MKVFIASVIFSIEKRNTLKKNDLPFPPNATTSTFNLILNTIQNKEITFTVFMLSVFAADNKLKLARKRAEKCKCYKPSFRDGKLITKNNYHCTDIIHRRYIERSAATAKTNAFRAVYTRHWKMVRCAVVVAYLLLL